MQRPPSLPKAPLSQTVYKVNAERNMRRYYSASLHDDLFGGTTVVREFGRIGHPGQILRDTFPVEDEAVDALHDHMQRKKKGGYCELSEVLPDTDH